MSHGIVYEYDPVTGAYDAPRACEVDDDWRGAGQKPTPRHRRKSVRLARSSRIKPSRKAARRRRENAAVVQAVRPAVADRDGPCRLYWYHGATPAELWRMFGACRGRSEFAHFGEKRRSKTVGQAPEERHDRAHSLMMCTKHHKDYDEHRLWIEALTERVCDGPLRFKRDGQTWEEPA